MNEQNRFPNRQEALAYLKKNPLACVLWGDQSAIYWNGKLSVQPANLKKKW